MTTCQNLTHSAPLNWRTITIAVFSCALLFLCMTYPAVPKLVYVKGSLFALILITIVLEHFLDGRSRLAYPILFWTVGLTFVSVFFILEGIAAKTPGATSVITVYILWPLTFALWMAGLSDRRMLLWIDRIAVAATLFIGIYGFLYLLTNIGILPENPLVSALSLGWEDEAFGSYEGYTEMAFAGINCLPFLLPFVIASIAIYPRSEKKEPIMRPLRWLACLFGCGIALTAGRRALLLELLLAPAMVLFFRHFQPKNEKKLNRRSIITVTALLVGCVVVLLLGLSFVYDFHLSTLWGQFTSAFDFGSQATADNELSRREQFVALLHGWMEHPFFGFGHGSGTLASVRSDTMPWAYELTYLALLFQVGIVGLAAYLAGVLWILRQGIKIIREGGPLGRIMLPILTGFLGMLIANATNPYLLKFDGMWMFFLPLAVINCHLVAQHQEPSPNYRTDPGILSTANG
jgi:hypothetical protein